MAVVVDTNIVSFIYKEDTRAALYEPHLLNVPKFISFCLWQNFISGKVYIIGAKEKRTSLMN
jgi:hypothetical protein